MSNEQHDNSNNQPVILVSHEGFSSARPWISFLVFFFLIAFIGGGFFYIQHQISAPLNLKAEERTFVVRTGESLTDIAENLEEEGLIKNNLYFIFYVWKGRFSNKLQAGNYLLSSAMSVSQIADKFKSGEVISGEITITIPEGFKIGKIGERLKKNNFQFSVLEFKIKDFKNKYDFFKDAPPESGLEGFLFPDTYKFYPEATANDVIEKMLDNFGKKFGNDLRTEILSQGKTIYQVVVMASLIEKEVKTFEDRQIVSGIFWKRLEEQRPLESCATIAYLLNLDKWRYSIEDTRKPSPYNTYLNRGLPPGPICNPGIESIKAAVLPKDSLYDFFLTDPETGNTIFSKTLEEHNINKAKYFK